MTASSSSLAKVCNMMKSDMDVYLLENEFDKIRKSFYNKESGEEITYYAYDTYKVIKSLHKREKGRGKEIKKQNKVKFKAAKKLEKGSAAREGVDCSTPVQHSQDDYDIPF